MLDTISNISIHDYNMLELLEQGPRLNHRTAAKILGCSVRLTHLTMTRLVTKGWVSIYKHHARRWDYFLTPEGMSEKARLAQAFLQFSMQFYRQSRIRSALLCRDLSEAGVKQVAFLGANDMAEIAYLGTQEWGLKVCQVFADSPTTAEFMKVPIQPICKLTSLGDMPIIVCLFNSRVPMEKNYLPDGIERRNSMHWVFSS